MKNIDIVSCRLIKDKNINSDIQITSPERAINLIVNSFNDLDKEILFVINCDSRLQPNNINIVSMGTVNSSFADPKEIFKTTILSNSSRIFIMHNHPSNILEPSDDDIKTYKQLSKIGKILNIECVDSIIFNYSKEAYSIKANKKFSINELDNFSLFAKKENIENEGETQSAFNQEVIINPILHFKGEIIPGLNENEIYRQIKSYLNEYLVQSDLDTDIINVQLVGSRTKGTFDENSDIDVLVEYNNPELREDDLFNRIK